MAFDLGTVIVAAVTTGGATAAAIFATRGQVAQATTAAQSTLAATAQRTEEVKIKAEDDFQTRILAELQRTQEKLETLGEKHNLLAIEHAELRGEVRILREARTALLAENTLLKAENVELKKKINLLDEENEAQGLKLSELNGRIAQLTGVTP